MQAAQPIVAARRPILQIGGGPMRAKVFLTAEVAKASAKSAKETPGVTN
jgi:hypothetical protein